MKKFPKQIVICFGNWRFTPQYSEQHSKVKNCIIFKAMIYQFTPDYI